MSLECRASSQAEDAARCRHGPAWQCVGGRAGWASPACGAAVPDLLETLAAVDCGV